MIFRFLIPESIRLFFRKKAKVKYSLKDLSEFQYQFFQERKAVESTIPKVDLERKHINNLTVLTNRIELLKLLPKNAVCAEIGVNEGEFSEAILKLTNPSKLHLVDAWGDELRYHDGLKLKVQERFNKEIAAAAVEINIGLSTTVLKHFPDHYFDWVYLDTDHSYRVTADELKLLNDKVKAGGIIAGHDYIIGNWVGGTRYGVVESVHEFCLHQNWELIYITINKDEMPSFAIRRIR